MEFDLLEKIMQKLRLALVEFSLIMTCVKSFSYTVLINGDPYGYLIPEIGIPQGKPLSYPFFGYVRKGYQALYHHQRKKA